jgi:GNAT superfamily N-acetyltransferase
LRRLFWSIQVNLKAEIKHIVSDADLEASFSVMKELRPKLIDPATYIAQVKKQREQGYLLLAAWHDGRVVGLAGYRFQDSLLFGRFVYVDDLVVAGSLHRCGLGEELLKAARQQAVIHHCNHFILDTGLHMALAQRFYFRQGLLAEGLHFVEPLSQLAA